MVVVVVVVAVGDGRFGKGKIGYGVLVTKGGSQYDHLGVSAYMIRCLEKKLRPHVSACKPVNGSARWHAFSADVYFRYEHMSLHPFSDILYLE